MTFSLLAPQLMDVLGYGTLILMLYCTVVVLYITIHEVYMCILDHISIAIGFVLHGICGHNTNINALLTIAGYCIILLVTVLNEVFVCVAPRTSKQNKFMIIIIVAGTHIL